MGPAARRTARRRPAAASGAVPAGPVPAAAGPVPPGAAAGAVPAAAGAVPPGQPPQGPGWAPQPQKKSSVGKWIAIAGGILVVAIIAVVALAFVVGGDPEVGDCLKQDGTDLQLLDCDDSEAAYRVIGIQEGEQSYDEYIADPETCAAFPEAIQSFWVGENGDNTGQGVVYCATTV